MPAKKGAKRKPATKRVARKTYKPRATKQSSDIVNMVCSCYLRKDGETLNNDVYGNGVLSNTAPIDPTNSFIIHASIALHADNPLFTSIQHGSYKNMFNEFNTKSIYIDLLFSKELRENAQQVFLLVEKGNKSEIVSEDAMCSDVQHKMYQLGNNTQKITFSHKFTQASDKINKLSVPANAPAMQDLTYLKILCIGKNHTAVAIPSGDLNIQMRVKQYNLYRDMKVLTKSLSLN